MWKRLIFFIHEDIKITLISGKACYHSVKTLLCSRLLSKNVKIKIYKTIILPLVFMGVKLGLTLRDEHKLRSFDNRVVRSTF
jgi:hypothetical protein